jgi:hypothetical protein
MPLDSAAALAKIKRDSDYSSDPALTDDQMSTLLSQAATATAWATATAYVYGQVIVPTVRNGHRYRCIDAGTSGGTEPTFPTGQGGTVTDGTCEWEECSNDIGELWDLRKATCEAWMLKAAMAAKRYDFESDEQSFKREQVHEHCLEMAKQFRPIYTV